eukprot:4974046-Pyramimonas_sp.AAC.1
MKEGGVAIPCCTGDSPDPYCALELGEDLASHLLLPGWSGDELNAILLKGSLLPGSGIYVGVKVVLVGFSWAC